MKDVNEHLLSISLPGVKIIFFLGGLFSFSANKNRPLTFIPGGYFELLGGYFFLTWDIVAKYTRLIQ